MLTPPNLSLAIYPELPGLSVHQSDLSVLTKGTSIFTYKMRDIPGFDDMVSASPRDSGLIGSMSIGSGNSSTWNQVLKYSKIHVKTKHNKSYSIIQYDKNVLSCDLVSTVGLLRSVIINEKNRVVGFAPPKSIPYHTFIERYPEKTESIVAEEFVNGIMVNVFWDPEIGMSGAWEISTRNEVGCDHITYDNSKDEQPISIREMFLEAARLNGLIWEHLNPQLCYSFVLNSFTHEVTTEQSPILPDMRERVNNILYLVRVYEICCFDGGVNSLDMSEVRENPLWQLTTIRFPQTFNNWNSWDELKDLYGSMNTDFQMLGVILYNRISGERSKLRNPVYEYIRSIQGKDPKVQYQYLCLRKKGMVSDYLTTFPEYKKEFYFFRDLLHNYTKALHENYLACYVRKNKQLVNISSQFKTHLTELHKLYLEKLRSTKLYVSDRVVIEYVNRLEPHIQMYYLNYIVRKRLVFEKSLE